MKICIKCDIAKPNDRFELESICKLCENELLEIRKEKQRNRSYKSNYNITLEEYERKLTSQEYKCAICNIHIKDLDIRLVVDHCHTTGLVRSLLCKSCNSGIGFLKEDLKILKAAVKYIEDFQKAIEYSKSK